MDPTLESLDLNPEEFVEFKTSRHMEHPQQKIHFRKFKTLKWWAQSFLVGVSTLIAGYRDDHGLVDRLKVYRIKDLPKSSTEYWKPTVTMNFLSEFLTFCKNVMNKSPDLSVIEFHFDPHSSRVGFRHSTKHSEALLPQWYTSIILS